MPPIEPRSLAFLVLIPVAWVCLSLLMARLSGWSLLAKRYRIGRDEDVLGEAGRFRTCQLGAIQYHSATHFVVTERGLAVSVALPLRLGHPRLLVPWSEMHRIESDGRLYSQRIKMSIGHPTLVRAVMPGWVRYRMPIEMRPPS